MKLFAINTPCWTELSPQGLSNDELFSSHLSEHFTFLYYNFMKYGLVDEVFVFLEEKRWRDSGPFSEKKLETEYGTISLFKESQKYDIINSHDDGYIYCQTDWENCKNFEDKFCLVNPMFSGYQFQNVLKKGIHDYALIEGEYYSRFLPDWVPFDVLRYITYDCTPENIKNRPEKKYDWIMVSSFAPRKRHLEFLESLEGTPLEKSRGCIIGRNPDNKKRYWEGHTVLEKIKKKQKDYNFDIFLNATQEQKIDLLLKSKVFVCVSALDNGPRAQIEAAQLRIPILSMPHIGSSDVVIPNKNGELIKSISEVPNILNNMLIKNNSYDCKINDKILDPDKFMPKIIENIKRKKNENISYI